MHKRMGNWKKGLSLIAIAMCGGTISSRAEQAGEGAGNALPETTIAKSLPNNGDPFDVRKDLAEDGITYGITYTGEVLGNPSGGIKQGSAYDGLVRAYVDIDFNKLVGWVGLSSHVSGYQIHSTRHVTSDDIGSLVIASNIEALDGTLLFEAWLEQKLLETLSIRFGQLAADQDFLISDTASLFIANTFGWPVLPSVDLPSGGPIYPLATPGIRVKYEPAQQVDALFAIYNGDPAGPGPGQPQERDPNGVAFRLTDPPLLIGELQWKHDQETDAATLPGTMKVGGWYHFGKFDDLRFGNDGLSLADPASSGQPLTRCGNFAIYEIVDQQLFRLSGQDDKKGISAFARIIGAPSDVNLVVFR